MIEKMEIETFEIKSGEKVLLLWKTMPNDESIFDNYISRIHEIVFPGRGLVYSHNVDAFEQVLDKFPWKFDVVLSGVIRPFTINHELELLSKIVEVSKPACRFYLTQFHNPSFSSALKLCGIHEKSVSPLGTEILTTEAIKEINDTYGTGPVQTGSITATRSIASKKPQPVGNVWSLPDDDLNDVDNIDSEDLLDPEDLKKPEASELRVCGTTGKRKACKDCSCGLREELDAGKEPGTKDVNSSCGSFNQNISLNKYS
ncbi:CIAPIN1 [Lepeophtheirus salmonis]|uniref:CIAPIN1 n=1 Tax=Lepeophtheirus salmonis TaxID=72036 RepID=A0A7R8HCD0_LEPSM|nr:CIAPIN1 [Lepeophtheirus salmonis]CAF3005598.1 CIAPIN1 [Lepeophtheirus salmonis]